MYFDLLITILTIVFSVFFPYKFLDNFSPVYHILKLTQIYYRGALLHAVYNFEFLFSEFLPFKLHWTNLVSKPYAI